MLTIDDITNYLGQISVETIRLQMWLPYAEGELKETAQYILQSQMDFVLNPRFIKWLTLDEKKISMNHEQQLQLNKKRTQWLSLAQEHLKALRMASDSIWQQFQKRQEFSLDMLRQFLDYLNPKTQVQNQYRLK